MHWIHRAIQMIKGIGLLITTVVKAALTTLRQRHAPRTTPTPAAPAPTSAKEITPGEPDPNTPPGEPEVITVGRETITLPAATASPVVLALGIALLLFGVATSVGYSVTGIILIAAGIGTWTWEAMHERHGK